MINQWESKQTLPGKQNNDLFCFLFSSQKTWAAFQASIFRMLLSWKLLITVMARNLVSMIIFVIKQTNTHKQARARERKYLVITEESNKIYGNARKFSAVCAKCRFSCRPKNNYKKGSANLAMQKKKKNVTKTRFLQRCLFDSGSSLCVCVCVCVSCVCVCVFWWKKEGEGTDLGRIWSLRQSLHSCSEFRVAVADQAANVYNWFTNPNAYFPKHTKPELPHLGIWNDNLR